MKADAKTSMGGQEMVDLCKQHTFFSWSAQNAVNPIPWSRADGIYFWDTEGKRYTDLSSQLVSTNLGYGNQHVINAISVLFEFLPDTTIVPVADGQVQIAVVIVVVPGN